MPLIVLPYPPTVNTYWRKRPAGGMFISEAGQAFAENAFPHIIASGIRLGGKARIRMVGALWVPDRRTRDIDNLWKPIMDNLARGGVYENDSQVDDLRMIRMGMDRDDPRVELWISELPKDWTPAGEFSLACR